MKQLVTQAIILSRTNYSEADRILTVLTPDHGKLRLLAKGVRRINSKLAGGVELFSISDITFVRGRGEIATLVSSRLDKHFGRIVEDLDRTMLAYELTKELHKTTEDEPGADYFALLCQTFEALDDRTISPDLIHFWFLTQLLRLGGHTPNLRTDAAGRPLQSDKTYDFSFEHMAFTPKEKGAFAANHIKFLRLAAAAYPVQTLIQVQGWVKLLAATAPLVQTMRTIYLRV